MPAAGGCAGVDGRGQPVRLLRAAGVRVAAGSGRCGTSRTGGPGRSAGGRLLAGLAPGYETYDAVSSVARAALGLPEVRVEAGFPAGAPAVYISLAGALSLAYYWIVVHRGGRHGPARCGSTRDSAAASRSTCRGRGGAAKHGAAGPA
ncbi:hypothetical protein [Streptomyces sp. KL116D]|uniref:hypothetical protein n=1 Tax=Streptomyces sp. KL116D TaxID=3045152 RepID=UPI0035569952